MKESRLDRDTPAGTATVLADPPCRDPGYVAGRVFVYAIIALAVVAIVTWIVWLRRD